MDVSKKQREPVAFKSLAELKRFIRPGVEFKTVSHANHADMAGLTRVVTTVQTVGFYSKIKDQPEHPFSTCNHGKGFYTDFGKAGNYIFDGTTVKVKDARKQDRGVIYELEFYDREQNMEETMMDRKMVNFIKEQYPPGTRIRLNSINKMAPDHYTRFIDVFGGSGTVTMSRPIQPGCMEVYNDFNSNLTNLFCCVKNRPLALLAELGFLPLNTRDDFNVLYKFLSKGEITDDYLQEEMELTEILLKPPEAEAICTLLLERAPRGDVRRAADFFKLVRYSFSGSSKSFGGKPCDIRRFFHLIWECSRRLANVIVENKDFEDVIRQYDRGDAWIYCDPPYFEAECYEVAFPKENHQRLHDTLLNCQGYVMVSYNYCPYICELYHEFYIFRVVRPNSMSQTAGSEYEEVIITNYDPRKACWQLSLESLLNCGSEARYELIHEPERPIKTTN